MTMMQASFAEKLTVLRASYARQLPDKIREVEEAVGHLLQDPGDAAVADLLHHLLHHLIGSSGTMGFAGVCSSAATLKALVNTPASSTCPSTPSRRTFLS